MSLQEIAFLLGFSDANAFIRALNQWNGFPPGHFRNQNEHGVKKGYSI
ncbi:helix-turn-helix domain-containing protein [Pseudoalteromonas rubra]|nr:helix-turn-helix domain-containing protein [Pseudoalteromonas rubra]